MPVTTRGIDIDGIMATALAASVGGQATSYWTDIKAAIGTNAAVVLKRNGTTVYKDFISGALNTASGALVLPASLDEPATTNTSADIHTGTWVLEIQNASDSNIAIIAPLGPPGTSDSLVMSQDLNGTQTVKFSACNFPPPGSLDVISGGSGTSYASIAERGITMMSSFNSDLLENFARTKDGCPSWAWTPEVLAQEGHSTNAAIVMGAEPLRSNAVPWWGNHLDANFADVVNDEWNDFLNWFVIANGIANGGHTASNTAVRLSQYETYVRNQNTKVWTRVAKATLGDADFYDKPWLASYKGDMESRLSGSYREYLIPHKNNLTDRLAHPFGSFVKIANFREIDCIAVGVKASLVKWNPSGADDRASANLLLAIGGDWYPQSNHSTRGTWLPGFGTSAAMQITTTEQWFVAACLSVARKDYLNAAGCVISATEYRNNPPPFGS